MKQQSLEGTTVTSCQIVKIYRHLYSRLSPKTRFGVSVKPPRGLNCGSGHETISQNLKYLSCSPREVFDTLGDGQKWSKVCK